MIRLILFVLFAPFAVLGDRIVLLFRRIRHGKYWMAKMYKREECESVEEQWKHFVELSKK